MRIVCLNLYSPIPFDNREASVWKPYPWSGCGQLNSSGLVRGLYTITVLGEGGGGAWCGGAWWLGVVPGLFMYRPDLSGGKGLSVASLGSVYRVSPTSVDYTVELPWFG